MLRFRAVSPTAACAWAGWKAKKPGVGAVVVALKARQDRQRQASDRRRPRGAKRPPRVPLPPDQGPALALAVAASLHLAIFPQAIRLSNQPTTRYLAVLLDKACRGCPQREPCTASPDGLTLRLHEHDAILVRARRYWGRRPAAPPGAPAHGRAFHRLADRQIARRADSLSSQGFPARPQLCGRNRWPPFLSGRGMRLPLAPAAGARGATARRALRQR
jgi:hypothetical protein